MRSRDHRSECSQSSAPFPVEPARQRLVDERWITWTSNLTDPRCGGGARCSEVQPSTLMETDELSREASFYTP